jgi:Uma2 family endonuclease
MTLADLDLNKIYSYADYFKWRFEERVELIKGKIFLMSPAPNRYHQFIAGKLHLEIGNYLKKSPSQVYFAPFDVRLPLKSKHDEDIYTVLQPDLCVICDKNKLLDDRGCLGAPDIVVEILSPSNSKKELKYKYDVYEESGVQEYWVVFPAEKTVMMYLLKEGTFVPSRPLVMGDILQSAVLPGLNIDLVDVFGEDEE